MQSEYMQSECMQEEDKEKIEEKEKIEDKEEIEHVIKHLVLSGGGPTGFLTYGAASYLSKQGLWSLANIKSIYGCSIGAYMGVVFSLGYDWAWLDDYFIKRPWEKVIEQSIINIIDVFSQKGIISEKFFIDSTMPLFRAKDLKDDTTLEELFQFNNIDIHMYACNINTAILEKIDISHTTHPNLSVIKALQMTMAVPVIFKPIFDGEDCYIDGGVLNNYPLNDCLQQQKCHEDEILGFKNIWGFSNPVIHEKSSILDFMIILMRKMQLTLDTETKQTEIKNTVISLVEDLASSYNDWMEILANENRRRQIIETGAKHAQDFIKANSSKTN